MKKAPKVSPAPSVPVEAELRLQLAAAREENAQLRAKFDDAAMKVAEIAVQAQDHNNRALDVIATAVATRAALDAALEVISMCNTSTCPQAVLDRLKAARAKVGA